MASGYQTSKSFIKLYFYNFIKVVSLTTIGVSKEVRNELMALKFESGYKNLDGLIRDLIAEHKKRKLIAASALFRERIEQKGLTLEDL